MSYQKLEATFEKISHLEHLRAIVGWDEAVMMPTGGATSRGKALSTLHSITHELLIDPSVGDNISAAKQETLNTWQTANLKWMEKMYVNAICLPVRLVQAITESRLQTEQAWRRYRAENNWQSFAPELDNIFQLIKEAAEIRAEKFSKNVYDVLLDDFVPGVTEAMIDPLFAILKKELPQRIPAIVEQQKQLSSIPLQGPFPIEQQKQLGFFLMQALGFDFNHGRLDVSHHPFCGGVPEDVRITTRYNEKEFISAMMGVCHETGHAIYEQQLPKKWLYQPVGRAHCMACHESQSLLVEMQVCRSREFMEFVSPLIKRQFGNSEEGYSANNLYALYTKVQPSLIRVDADEVSYPLHIILRYEIEKSLFKNEISIKELPEVWRLGMLELLNVDTTNNYRDGVLQDVHWPAGLYGYFPAYTLGSLAASQIFASILTAHPTLLQEVQHGKFTTLFAWLEQHIHRHASSLDFQQLLFHATGSTLNPKFFLDHIQKRYNFR